MSHVKSFIAAVGVSLLPSVVFAQAEVQADCGSSTASFSGEIETVSGYNEHGDPSGPIQLNLDGTYPAEPGPVLEMTMARFDYQACSGEEEASVYLDRRQVAESLLLHTVLENPSAELIAQEIEFGAQYITTEEEALESLAKTKNFLIPHDALVSAFDAFSEVACPAPEYQYLKGSEAAGFDRTTYPRIEVDAEFLDANFICPTFN